MPTVELDVYRDKQKIETISLANRSVFIFGRNQTKCNVPLLHESISRQHAAIVMEKTKGVQLVDLGSRAGTKLNGKSLDNCIPMQLK
jgi:pSer/pThr/pTyr-binding forkhead associated (FHA) protein